MKIESLIKNKNSFPARIEPGPVSSQKSTLPTAPLKLEKERISSPNLNSKETAHVAPTGVNRSPSSRVEPSIISKDVHFI